MLGNDRNTIGVFLSVPQESFQSQVCITISKVGSMLGYNTVFYCNFGSHDDTNVDYSRGEKSIVTLPDYNKLAGVILLTDCLQVPGMLDDMQKVLKRYPSIPVVSLREYMPEYYSIILDDITAMDVVMDHILGFHNHKKVYFMSGPADRADGNRRLSSYKRKMREYGCHFEDNWIFYGDFWSNLYRQAADWIENEGIPEVVVCANDYMAVSLMEELERRGYRVPDEVKITGFDDIDKASKATTALTTVRVPVEKMAAEAIDIIDRLIKGDEIDRITYVETELVVRESCGCYKKSIEDYIEVQHNYYYENERLTNYNWHHLLFSRAAQNKHDMDGIFKTAFDYVSMLEDYKRMHFCMNESGDIKRFPVQSVLKYVNEYEGDMQCPDLIFDTDQLLPLTPNNQPQSMYVFPIHHEDKLFGYVTLEMNDYIKLPSFFANYLVTISNSLEKISQERQVRKSMKMEKMARKQAEKANRIKDDFLVNLSHEIRTPLNAILGLTNMLRDENLTQTGMGYLTTIKYSSDNLLRMISDILDYSQMNAGELTITRDEYLAVDLIKDIRQILEMYCVIRDGLEYKCVLGDNVPVKLIGDKERIEQIMVNLCSNASKFTESGDVVVSVNWEDERVLDDSYTNDGWLTLSVKDTGIGIRKEHIKTIFGAFTQIDSARIRSKEGAGMGLAVCNMLAETMGGKITVDSVFGEGSNFVVRIPQEISQRTGMEELDNQNISGNVCFTAPQACVLVVDDNLMNLKVESLLLKKYQIRVITAMSGMKAIDILDKNKNIDLVFMDYMMPEMDGVEATQIIKSKGISVPVVAVTANTVNGAADMYYSAGMKDYLPKPIEMNKLEEVLHRWIPEDKQVIIG